MKKARIYQITIALAAFGCAMTASAQGPVIQSMVATDTTALGVSFSDIYMGRVGDMMSVKMDMNLANTKMHGDRAIVYAPIIVGAKDSLMLDPIGLYGHVRWIQYQRNDEKPIGGPNETSYRFSKRPESIGYSELVPYESWMDNATLVLRRADYGCCNHLLDENFVDLARWRQVAYTPNLKYIRPVAAKEKRRVLEGQAYIDFPVDQTIIYPDYRRNTFELDSIQRTIDVVRDDPDATIETVWLKGFASPESPYKHNTDLAIGRTAALKNLIQQLYDFDESTILTDYEPEDWEGLRRFVVDSNLPHRNEIIALIDSDMAPDPKEARIKKLYPDEYEFMHQQFYPALRHTNYRVSYIVRSYTDPQEILKVMRTRPGNLDLDEFYIAASIFEPGSDEFNEVFETAVHVYPNDATANLNAANSALQRNDLSAARKYLEKAGDTAEALYARSVYNALSGNYKAAEEYLRQAQAAGIEVDAEELSHLQNLISVAPLAE